MRRSIISMFIPNTKSLASVVDYTIYTDPLSMNRFSDLRLSHRYHTITLWISCHYGEVHTWAIIPNKCACLQTGHPLHQNSYSCYKGPPKHMSANCTVRRPYSPAVKIPVSVVGAQPGCLLRPQKRSLEQLVVPINSRKLYPRVCVQAIRNT